MRLHWPHQAQWVCAHLSGLPHLLLHGCGRHCPVCTTVPGGHSEAYLSCGVKPAAAICKGELSSGPSAEEGAHRGPGARGRGCPGPGSPQQGWGPRERSPRARKSTERPEPEGAVTQSLEAHRRIGVRRKRRPGPKSHGRVGVRGTGRLRTGAGLLGRGGPGDSGRSYPLRGAGAAL